MLTLGRVLFALATCAFGVLHFDGSFAAGLPPWPQWTPATPFTAYLLGVALVLAGVALLVPAFVRQAALGIAVLFGVGVLLHANHIPLLFTDPSEPTRVLVPLALCATALVLYGALEPRRTRARTVELIGRYVFAACLLAFGLQHFKYAAFLASIVPNWYPMHLVLVYFTGSAMIAAGLAIAVNVLARWACALVGLMFFLWVLTLHGPRVAGAMQNGSEWASLFVALAMAGASWIVASTFTRGKMDIA